MYYRNMVRKYFIPDAAGSGATVTTGVDQGDTSPNIGAAQPAAKAAQPAAKAAPPANALPSTQAEFDRRVQQAIDTARAAWEQSVTERVNTAVSEAQKLANMTAEQKAEHARKTAEQKLAQREAEVTRRELTATAKETLASKGLPIELADVLDYSDAKKCSESIDSVAKAFEKVVSKAVDDRLRQTPPKTGDNNTGLSGVEQAFYALNPNLKG